MKITGLSHLFKWENLHNWWLTKYFFAPLYLMRGTQLKQELEKCLSLIRFPLAMIHKVRQEVTCYPKVLGLYKTISISDSFLARKNLSHGLR